MLRIKLLLLLLFLSVLVLGQAIEGLIKDSGPLTSCPNANQLVIFDSTKVQVEETGLSHVFTHRLIKIITPAGAKSLNVIKYDYDPLSAYVEIRKVTVYKVNGKKSDLNITQTLDYPAPARAIYWGAREKMTEVGRLEPGDAVEVFLYRKGFTYALLQQQDNDDERYIPPMKGQFYDIVPFWTAEPVKEKVYQVSVPKSKPLQFEFYNGEATSKVESKGNRFVYTFSKRGIMPWKGEAKSLDATDLAPKLLLSSSPDWKSKSLWFYNVNEDYKSFETTPAIKAKVAEILRNAKNEMDSISLLTHWAGDEIRYSGISMGKGEGYTLHSGEMDFNDRCGVCKDKAGMLITLLRTAGFEAYPAMTMAGSRIDYIPADQFNHCVTVVKSRRDGRYQLLDPTWVPFLRELWSSAEQQQNYLMGVPEGADLAETPLSDPQNHYLRIRGKSEILTDGTLVGEYLVTAEGQTDGSIRGMFTKAYKADWSSNIEKEILKVSPLARIETITYGEPYNYLDGPINIRFKVRVPDYALITKDEVIFIPFVINGFMKRAMPHLSFETGLETRAFPFRDRTSHALDITEEIKIAGNLQSGSRLPEKSVGKGNGASYEGGYTLNGNMLSVNLVAEFPKRIYPAQDWPSFREAVKFQNALSSTPVILMKK